MKILRKVNMSRVPVPYAQFGYFVSVEIMKNVIEFLPKKD